MENAGAVAEKFREVSAGGNFRLDEIELAGGGREVGSAASGKVIDDGDLMAFGDEAINEVRADEAGAAGDEVAAHWVEAVTSGGGTPRASATASASFWRNSGVAMSLASSGLER